MATTLTIRLREDLLADLEAEARRANRTKGAIVREALEARLRAGSASESALAALEKYAGCMTGPRDLSTNKRHLAGFGARTRRG